VRSEEACAPRHVYVVLRTFGLRTLRGTSARPEQAVAGHTGAAPFDQRHSSGQQYELGTGKVGSKSLKRADRSLVCFVMALQGHDVIIELRNGVFLRGTVYIADVFMKCVTLPSLNRLVSMPRLRLCCIALCDGACVCNGMQDLLFTCQCRRAKGECVKGIVHPLTCRL
jgi:hypothetical protein